MFVLLKALKDLAEVLKNKRQFLPRSKSDTLCPMSWASEQGGVEPYH